MKLLLIHSDYLEYEPKQKAIGSAEEVEKELKRIDECLVVFTAVEKKDEKNPKISVSNTVKEITEVAKQLHVKKVVIYPFVHLTAEPSGGSTGMHVLKEIELALKTDYEVYRAPFGWYKHFKISCKGHPLSELSKDVVVDVDSNKALEKEETLKSEWYIMKPNGEMHPIEMKNKKIHGFDFSQHKNLEKFAKYEMSKSRTVEKEPPHIKLMKKLGLVSYEQGSDPGHFRFLPKGKMIKHLVEEHVTNTMIKNGALEVETPIMYDYEHPSLKKYLNRFPARQYTIQTPNKNTFLRFSACFGQFLIMHDAGVSYRNLPLWMYELTKYSFRVEQRGELAGLRRLRAFTMPDCHAFCKDVEQAKKELIKRLDISMKLQEELGVGNDSLEFALRSVKDFYNQEKNYIKSLAKKWNKPILVEMWDKRFFYFILKYELNFVDALNKAAALTTDQIDIENGERYGLFFTDKDNKKKNPIILHLSPSGAIERVIYVLLEKAYMEQQAGKNPLLPLWLSPVQVRLCPVNENFVEHCENIAEEMENKGIRVDVDDRTESIGKKIRDAEVEWVPLTIVIGEKEKKKKKLPVRFRQTGKVEEMLPEDIIKWIHKETRAMPNRPLPMARLLSKRPVFI